MYKHTGTFCTTCNKGEESEGEVRLFLSFFLGGGDMQAER